MTAFIDGHICWNSNRQLGIYYLSFVGQGNKLTFSVSVFSNPTEVCRFRFQQTNGSCRFTLVSFLLGKFQKHRDMEMET
jgi:hypothetical protein